ncbi:MAG: hypothetical protein HKN06_10385 [Gammaproteobacteria bacterium]|nr:hypothetical protein [Gammaproteobacteria bacterium]
MPSTTEKKRIVSDFLRRCNAYADAQLERYGDELKQAGGRDELALQDKIGHWTAYRAFNEHTLEELAADTLDDWFSE